VSAILQDIVIGTVLQNSYYNTGSFYDNSCNGGNFIFASDIYQTGWPNYAYGGTNKLQLTTRDNTYGGYSKAYLIIAAYNQNEVPQKH